MMSGERIGRDGLSEADGMLLAIDVGNTNTKFAVYDGEAGVASGACHRASRTADEYACLAVAALHGQGFDPKSITASIMSSVVPSVNQTSPPARLLRQWPGDDRRAGARHGVRIDKPSEAGADRLVNADRRLPGIWRPADP